MLIFSTCPSCCDDIGAGERLTAFEGVGPIGLCGGTLSYNQRLCKITRVADDPIDVVWKDEVVS